jgi:PAS domain S-box-containing protein
VSDFRCVRQRTDAAELTPLPSSHCSRKLTLAQEASDYLSNVRITGHAHVSNESPHPLTLNRKIILWLGGLVLLLAVGVTFSAWSYRQIENAADHRDDSSIAIGAAQNLMDSLVDAETGQRGYVLTGEESYLIPYLAARDSLVPHLGALRELTSGSLAQQHVDAISPLLVSQLDQMEKRIAMRRNNEAGSVLWLINSDAEKRLMDAIRLEIRSIVQVETSRQIQQNKQFDEGMRRLFFIVVGLSVMALILVILFGYSSYRATQQRIKNLVHGETLHLLTAQTLTSERLQEANRVLQDSEQKLAITLSSIGDGVIATDSGGCVTLLNRVAEDLTGWTQAQAFGLPANEVFHIVNRETRESTNTPVADALAHGTVQGLANHTVLIARDGREFDIADSCAPIRDADTRVVGAVLVFRNVTDENAAEQTLRDSAARVQTVLNTVGDGIVTLHADGGIMESANPAIERLFGYSAAELNGKGFGLLIPELDQEHHKVSLEHYGVSVEERTVGLGREVVGVRKNGSQFPLEITVSEMVLGSERYFTGILRDISARKQAEEALRKAGALQNAIFNSANFSSIATDAKGVIQIFNVGAERMLGYSAKEVMDKITPAEISDPQEIIARAQALSAELETKIAPGFDALVFKASRGMEDIYELTYIRKDGSRFPAVVSVTALRGDDNAIIGYLLIGTDNTARKAVEAERAQLDQDLQLKNVELEASRTAANKANQAKSDFLSSMSHELRSPLNAILGFAQLMETSLPEPTPAQAGSIQQILKAGWYLLELINEILDLALIESGRLSMSLEPVSLTEVLMDCQTMIQPQADRRGIRMSFPTSNSPCFVDADPTRLKQVVVNLLSNAIKYNRVDGTVEVSSRIIDQERLHISVRDTGEGLSDHKLSQLFQPFNRLGQEDSGEEGTGIGLVVSKQLVELMGGTIGAFSDVGVGSEFWFELRLAEPHVLVLDDEPLPVIPIAPSGDGVALRTLLYVEDNKANMDLVAQLIARRADIRLLRAEDGLRGMALARAHLPDMILMDINLPGISGLQALRLLREGPETRHIPVLALSANAMPRDIERGMEAGFYRYLTKPIKIDEFMLALDQCVALTSETQT